LGTTTIIDMINQYGVPTVVAVGMAYFIYYVWKFVTHNILPSLGASSNTLVTIGPEQISPRFKVVSLWPTPSSTTVYMEYYKHIKELNNDNEVISISVVSDNDTSDSAGVEVESIGAVAASKK